MGKGQSYTQGISLRNT